MDDARLHTLAELARYSILAALDLARQPPPDSSPFAARGAAFVTLTQATRLRGCIGTLEAWRTLAEDVAANARAAAMHDPRFPALTVAELPHTLVEVSVLEPATPLTFTALAKIGFTYFKSFSVVSVLICISFAI